MKTSNPIQAVQKELQPIMKELSKHIDSRSVRNIGKAAVGIINARSTRISEITHKSKRRCKRLITDAKRNYRLLKSKTWEKADLEHERFKSIRKEIQADTPIGIDLSHIEHPDSKKIEGLSWIKADNNKFVLGHNWLQAAARIDYRRILPLNSHVFSHSPNDSKSMNQINFDFLDNLYNYIGNNGIWLFDRGFDSKALMEKLLSLNVKFIMRLRITRDVFVDGKKTSLKSIFKESDYPYKSKIRMKRKPRIIEFDYTKINVAGINEKLQLVFTRSHHGETYILLTNIKVESPDGAIKILKTYRYRWSVEDFFRVMKQDIGINKVMVRTLRRINKLIEIAMLAYYIAFKILMIGGKFIESIILAGGKLGLKKKNEDTVGRILKGLANTVLLL